MNFLFIVFLLIVFIIADLNPNAASDSSVDIDSNDSELLVLKKSDYQHYIIQFNHDDDVLIDEINQYHVSNKQVWTFLCKNIPFINVPDKKIEKTYYFRFWTYRKHIKLITSSPDIKIKDGSMSVDSIGTNYYVITEFLRRVPWAGKHNTISCAAAHHFNEGRWLHDTSIIESYANFWFKGDGSPRSYSFWPAHAILEYEKVTGNNRVSSSLLPYLKNNFNGYKKTNYDVVTGLWFNIDDRDGMELSIGGGSKREQAFRPTLNSYMYAEAIALAAISNNCRDVKAYAEYTEFATALKMAMNEWLWDKDDQFYKAKQRVAGNLVDVRELHGMTPWYFSNLTISAHQSIAWKQVIDRKGGFLAPFGLTTAEQRHPLFKVEYNKVHECSWNGPTWPYATSITLSALANYINDSPIYNASIINKNDYFGLLATYAAAHVRVREDNKRTVSWIDENINPYTGDWMSRTMLRSWVNNTQWSVKKGGIERGKDYNHSTFVDLIISGLFGIRANTGNDLVINPLVPESWEYFCIDNLLYHRVILTVYYDKSGTKYNKGVGYFIYMNGMLAFHSSTVIRAIIRIDSDDSIDAQYVHLNN